VNRRNVARAVLGLRTVDAGQVDLRPARALAAASTIRFNPGARGWVWSEFELPRAPDYVFPPAPDFMRDSRSQVAAGAVRQAACG
jgi:hypothetical protein